MMYVLGDTPGNNHEAFDALENAFGPREFSSSEAGAVLQGALELSELDASRLTKELIKTNVIVGADK